MSSIATISPMDQDLLQAAESLQQLASRVVDFFLDADNETGPELLDLDPREGFVRLGETDTRGLLGSDFRFVRGLMNPQGEFQAVLTSGSVNSVLTVSEQGREVCLCGPREGRTEIETLSYRTDGQPVFVREVA